MTKLTNEYLFLSVLSMVKFFLVLLVVVGGGHA